MPTRSVQEPMTHLAMSNETIKKNRDEASKHLRDCCKREQREIRSRAPTSPSSHSTQSARRGSDPGSQKSSRYQRPTRAVFEAAGISAQCRAYNSIGDSDVPATWDPDLDFAAKPSHPSYPNFLHGLAGEEKDSNQVVHAIFIKREKKQISKCCDQRVRGSCFSISQDRRHSDGGCYCEWERICAYRSPRRVHFAVEELTAPPPPISNLEKVEMSGKVATDAPIEAPTSKPRQDMHPADARSGVRPADLPPKARGGAKLGALAARLRLAAAESLACVPLWGMK